MNYFLSQLINGLSIGSIYALVAIGYTMVYGIVKLINFAHGDVIMVGSYLIFYFATALNIPFWIALPLSMLLCGILGVVIEKIAYKPLRKAPSLTVLITAIGVSIFLQNLFMLIFGAESKSFPVSIEGALSIGELSIPYISIVTVLVGLITMTALTLFIKKTKIGKAMRAVSEDGAAASLMGINVNNTISLTFALGSMMAVIGGALYSMSYSRINPFIGSIFGLKAFIAAVLGGIGIIPGAMLGGISMGIIESMSKASNISSVWSDTIVFSILILVLLFKPSGILGKNVKEKV